jgi:hypothetical protein
MESNQRVIRRGLHTTRSFPEAAFLHGKLKAMASEPSTIRNYKKRADELEERYTLQTFDINK